MAWTFLLMGPAGLLLTAVASGGAPDSPNIVLVLADDLGWAELGCYGNDFNETPHLDRLAALGMRFTQAYAAAPVCSPTRAALLTGQFPARVGIVDYLRPQDKPLSTDHFTIAEALKQNGYATGFIGKWHLTGYKHHGAAVETRATDHGFDEELVTEVKGVGNGANFYPYIFRDQTVSWTNVKRKRLPGSEFLVDRMNLEAVEFIERSQHQPFFLFLSHFATHTILRGKPGLVEKYQKKHKPGPSTRTRCTLCADEGLGGDAGHHWAGDHNPHLAAMLESIDDGVGMIMAKLKELGIADNTLLIFTSDNGGEAPNVTSNAPLRGGKSQLYEGGIRVPLVTCWPGRIPTNTVCRQPTVTMDFYPTFVDAAGVSADLRQRLDGVSLLPTLRDPNVPVARHTLYWHYPLQEPHFLGGLASGAIRKGNWKLIEYFDSSRVELYDLAADSGENQCLAEGRPQVTAELKRMLEEWRHEVQADE